MASQMAMLKAQLEAQARIEGEDSVNLENFVVDDAAPETDELTIIRNGQLVTIPMDEHGFNDNNRRAHLRGLNDQLANSGKLSAGVAAQAREALKRDPKALDEGQKGAESFSVENSTVKRSSDSEPSVSRLAEHAANNTSAKSAKAAPAGATTGAAAPLSGLPANGAQTPWTPNASA
jgi:hypothetical protein